MRWAELESAYVPGHGWTAAVRGRLAVLLPVSTADSLLPALWDALGSGAGLYDVLGALTREHGLGDLPPFGILERGERLRLVVRGAVSARVTTAAGSEEVSGADVGTWSERAVAGWTGAELTADGAATPSDPQAAAYPLNDGAAPAVTLFLGARVAGPPATISAAVPEATLGATLIPADADASPDASPNSGTDASHNTGTDASPEAEQQPDPESPADQKAPAESHTVDYDHLWEQTVVRNVEDAAVRSGDEGEGAASGAGDTVPDPAPPSPDAGEPAPQGEPAPSAAAVRPARDVGAHPAAAHPALIDSVPWAHSPSRSEQSRSITSELFGDHDGETILRSELAPETEAPTAGAAAPEPEGDPAPPDAPMVLGRSCPSGHANPPTNAQCRRCGAELSGEARQVPRPALGRVRFADGELVELVEPLVVGRQPSVSRVASGGMPRLVTVESPAGDVSRNHLEVRLEGWHVMVRDLKATNGTVLERDGQPSRRLGQGEMAIVLDGDVADLGDGVTIRFEDIP